MLQVALPTSTTPNQTKLLDTKAAADIIGFKPRMLEMRRIRGDGPPYVRISARGIRYRMEDLEVWIQSLVKSSTAQ